MSKINKSILRKELLSRRNSIPADLWFTKSQMICDRLKSLPLFKQSSTVFAYFSFRQEPDLSSLFSIPKNWVFPRCINKSLVWHLWHPEDNLKTNKYGIKEPLKTAKIIAPNQADLIIVPAVSIDLQGFRLGYGGGFYDRLLSSPLCLTTNTVAILFDITCTDDIPIDSWDRKINYLCTESRFKSFLVSQKSS